QGKVHGLQSLGNSTAIPKLEADPVTPPYDALTYLRQPGSGTVNATGTPRQKDRYILIGAGVDRTYGTDDDLTSFGDVR
ncbi:MAG TPA: hypothetical protein VEA69_19050, partial [Tepidisphaeraceae bacterium]|nr:hypothetical protein [Tepidisphaeraceae bacterium]